MEASLGRLVVSLEANTARFESALTKAEHQAKQSMDKLAEIFGIGLSIGGIEELVRSSVEAADHLGNLAKTTSLTVEQLSGLQLAAKKTGTDLDGAALSIERMSVNMGKNAQKFAELGIAAKDPLKAFEQLADVLVGIADPEQRAAVAAVALGKGWMTAAPLLMRGSDTIAEMVQKGTELSGNIEEMARRSEEFNGKLAEMHQKYQGLITNALIPLLPMMQTLADYLSDTGKNAKAAGEQFEGLKMVFQALVIAGAEVSTSFQELGMFLDGLAMRLNALAHGDLKEFKSIGQAIGDGIKQADADLAAFENKILNPPAPPPAKSAPTGVHTSATALNKFIGGNAGSSAADVAGYEVIIKLEKDFQQELAKRQQLINAPLLSASQKQLADDLLTIGNRAQTARVELEKLNLSGTLSLSDYHARLLQVGADEANQIVAVKALAAQQDKLNASWEYGAKVALRTYLDEVENVAKSTEALMTKAFKGMEDALLSFVQTGKLDFSSLANSIIADLIRIQIQQSITGPLARMMGTLGGGPALGTGLAANGAWFDNGTAHFAQGGVVDNPTRFAFANGGGFSSGLMGEAGPEAIMPLKRAADGSLGIVASGSGKSTSINYAPVIHIDSRTDQAQVVQLVQSAVRQGQVELVDRLQRQGAL